jgi:hypothetical protein
MRMVKNDRKEITRAGSALGNGLILKMMVPFCTERHFGMVNQFPPITGKMIKKQKNKFFYFVTKVVLLSAKVSNLAKSLGINKQDTNL